ncbi:hypothetical protein [Polycladidibacter hongkongensis]|uniref:hypothetical protein n=1 Tax=Polycladidibacter hongkongensis TaxID=1647556 RepID=UPI000833CC68|nr:hypothetical protein [Pseudovibrio hongkongensis]
MPNFQYTAVKRRAATVSLSEEITRDRQCVDAFAEGMKQKLATSILKGRRGWRDAVQVTEASLEVQLRSLIGKGNAENYIDIANLAMMLHFRSGGVVPSEAQPCTPDKGLDAADEAFEKQWREALLAAAHRLHLRLVPAQAGVLGDSGQPLLIISQETHKELFEDLRTFRGDQRQESFANVPLATG